MATVQITIHKHEKDRMIVVIAKNKGKTMSVAALAKEAGYNPNRTRFIIEEMLQDGSIRRTPTKVFNPRYIRYSYEVTGK